MNWWPCTPRSRVSVLVQLCAEAPRAHPGAFVGTGEQIDRARRLAPGTLLDVDCLLKPIGVGGMGEG